jgi:hypothetical protein
VFFSTKTVFKRNFSLRRFFGVNLYRTDKIQAVKTGQDQLYAPLQMRNADIKNHTNRVKTLRIPQTLCIKAANFYTKQE